MDRFSRLKSNKGFTLVEVVLAILLLGVVLTTVFTFFQFGNLTYRNDSEQYNLQKDARLDMDKIISDVQYADQIYIIEDIPTDDEKAYSTYSYIYINEGKLYFSIYDNSAAKRTETTGMGDYVMLDSCFKKDTLSVDSLYIKLSSEDNNQSYLVDATVKLLNLKIDSNSVQGISESKVIKFKLPIEN